MSFTLTFETLDRLGDLNEKEETISIEERGVFEAVRAANDHLSKPHGVDGLPFMPTLKDASGTVVACTVPQPPHAHRLVWIAGKAIGSNETWVLA